MKDVFKLLNKPVRTGTKLVIYNWYVSIGIVIFLNIILPIIGIWVANIKGIMSNLNVSATTIALLGQSGVTTAANEIRKAIENKSKG